MSVGSNFLCGRPHGSDPVHMRPPEPDPSLRVDVINGWPLVKSVSNVLFERRALLLAARTSGRKSLIVPLEVRVRDVCCVGLSTQDTLQVQNPSENWVKVTFEVTKVTVDGKPMNDCFTCPFSLKNKTLIEPKSSEEIKVVEMTFKSLYIVS